jgi:hypothetical protein
VLTSAAGAALHNPAFYSSRCRVCFGQHATTTATPVTRYRRRLDAGGIILQRVRYRYPGTDHVNVMEECRVSGVLARCRDCACDFLSRCRAGCSSLVFMLSRLPSLTACRGIPVFGLIRGRLCWQKYGVVARGWFYAGTLSLRGTPKSRTVDSVCGDHIVLERSGYALSPTWRAWLS